MEHRHMTLSCPVISSDTELLGMYSAETCAPTHTHTHTRLHSHQSKSLDNGHNPTATNSGIKHIESYIHTVMRRHHTAYRVGGSHEQNVNGRWQTLRNCWPGLPCSRRLLLTALEVCWVSAESPPTSCVGRPSSHVPSHGEGARHPLGSPL